MHTHAYIYIYIYIYISTYVSLCTRITPLFPSESSRLVRSAVAETASRRLFVNVVIATIEPFAPIVRRDLRE